MDIKEILAPYGAVPTEIQYEWLNRKTAFIHLTVNTFTDREWGDGTESPDIFNPTRFDPAQWVAAFRDAGMKGLILTCKHHDGFCLWPSRFTDHTVAASPFHRDAVRAVSEACRAAGLAFGVYLSPWDRHSPLYGQGKPYDDFYTAQLEELLTSYGPVFSVWMDGAGGEGPSGRKQHYDWNRYIETVRRLQPDACISICGPDIRWCGNEAGFTRDAEWSVVPRRTMDTEKIASLSQQNDDAAFRLRRISASDRDLGSRQVLKDEQALIWYPAEVNTSIRPGWFWHENENGKVKPLEKLIDIYERSVGGNATFLLNVPPTREGLLHGKDVARLHEFGEYLRAAYGENLVCTATLTASKAAAGHGIDDVRKDDERYYIPAQEDGTAEITLIFPQPRCLDRLVMKEQLRLSQRVEAFEVDALLDGIWRCVTQATVIGHKRIIRLNGIFTQGLRIRITDARVAPTLKFIGVYC